MRYGIRDAAGWRNLVAGIWSVDLMGLGVSTARIGILVGDEKVRRADHPRSPGQEKSWAVVGSSMWVARVANVQSPEAGSAVG